MCVYERFCDFSKLEILLNNLGGGKNYVSRIIVDNIFKQKSKSNFVHQFVATLHFPHSNEVETYRVSTLLMKNNSFEYSVVRDPSYISFHLVNI